MTRLHPFAVCALLAACASPTEDSDTSVHHPALAKSPAPTALVPFEQIPTPTLPASVSDVGPTGAIAMTIAGDCARGAAPAVWQPIPGLTSLPGVPGTCGGRARAVNGDAVVVGSAYFDAGSGLSVRWRPAMGGYAADVLPSLPDGSEAAPVDINAAGAIGAANAAAVWTEATGWTMLAMPSGATYCHQTFLNDAGQVVASCVTSGLSRTVLWSSVDALPITLPLPAGATQSWPTGINGPGVIAGYTGGATTRAVRWSRGETWTATVLPDIGKGGKANGLNGAGYVVGFVYQTNGDGIPVYWEPSGTLHQMQTVRSGVAVGVTEGTSGLVIAGYVKTGRSVSDQIAVRWLP